MGKKLPFRAGMVAITGCPNSGKSTLLNHLLGCKVSITSKRSNTTRHRILGVLNEPNCQYVFIDMPGFNLNRQKYLDYAIHKTAVSSISGTDLVVLLIDRKGLQKGDTAIVKQIQEENLPAIVAINKIDLMTDKSLLLPVMENVAENTGIREIVPISALKSENIDHLKSVIARHLPESPPLFPADYVTDRNERFQVSELVREQIFRFYGNELPYACAVEIEKFSRTRKLATIHALVWVETDGQKRIVIGSKGEKLKQVSTVARQQLEHHLNQKVYLRIWVKTRDKWTQDKRFVESFGYTDIV